MDTLEKAENAIGLYETIENSVRADHQRQVAESYALLAVAQELQRMNEHLMFIVARLSQMTPR